MNHLLNAKPYHAQAKGRQIVIPSPRQALSKKNIELSQRLTATHHSLLTTHCPYPVLILYCYSLITPLLACCYFARPTQIIRFKSNAYRCSALIFPCFNSNYSGKGANVYPLSTRSPGAIARNCHSAREPQPNPTTVFHVPEAHPETMKRLAARCSPRFPLPI